MNYLLERVSFQKTRLVTLSDFIVHYGNVYDKNARDLRATINDVTSATHCRDNILDPGDWLGTDRRVGGVLADRPPHHLVQADYKQATASAKGNSQQFARDLIISLLITIPAGDVGIIVIGIVRN